jgi:hypothetical protein
MSDVPDRFESWLAAEFRRPVRIASDGPDRVMSAVRSSAPAARKRRRGATPSAAFAFAACTVGIIAFRMATLLVPVTSAGGFAGRDSGLRDTISSFRDSLDGTARLVGVAVIAPAAARIAVVHDFHGWDLHIAPASSPDEHVVRGATASISAGLHLSLIGRPSAQDAADTLHGGAISDSVPERR